jgi:ketosteroid isomerase-like protein
MTEQHEQSNTSIIAAAERLSDAFAARDIAAALACFVTDDNIGYVGSEHAENAAGRAAVGALLTKIFARHEAYSWQITTVSVREYTDCAYLLAEADGLVHTDAGGIVPFPYRISGILEEHTGQWRWRHCHGCEPQGKA